MLFRYMKLSVFNQFLNFSSQRSSSVILNGQIIAKEIKEEIKNEILQRTKNNLKRPKLVTILVGNNKESHIYTNNKIKAAKFVGIETDLIKLEKNISEIDLLAHIQTLNNDKTVDGILVQLPLPNHINEYTVCHAVTPQKDVDGFHFVNIGRMFYDIAETIMPCTPLAVIEILKRSCTETVGKLAVVCGRSKNVGLPIAVLLQADSKKTPWGFDCTASICNRNTPPSVLKKLTKEADIIVSATGIPHLIDGNMVKPGVCVIDVGITRIPSSNGKTKLVGDVNFDEVSKIAGYITPVPGGVGPVTVAMLMKNTLDIVKRNDSTKKDKNFENTCKFKD